MTNPKWEEQIIAVPTNKLFENVERFQGVLSDEESVKAIYDAIEENFIVMRRGNTNDATPKENNAEINYDFKQPIPYVVIRRGDKVFCYERLIGGGETRLHNKISLGVGGHMNKERDSFADSLLSNMYRELEEELEISPIQTGGEFVLQTIGILNDDTNEVSQVHVGILLELILPEGTEVEVKEKDQLKGFWSSVKDLETTYYDRLESWSQIAVDNMKA